MRNAAVVLLASASMACGSKGVTDLDARDAATDATIADRDAAMRPVQDASGIDSGGPRDAGVDTGGPAVPDDASRAPDAAVVCGAGAACTGGQVCCGTASDAGAAFGCQASCTDAGFTFSCDGPEDCAPAGAHCCATLQLGAGTFPACPPSAGGAVCRQICNQQIPLSCQATGQVRLCKTRSDCAGADNAGYTECCAFSQGAGSATFCATPQIANFGTCLN